MYFLHSVFTVTTECFVVQLQVAAGHLSQKNWLPAPRGRRFAQRQAPYWQPDLRLVTVLWLGGYGPYCVQSWSRNLLFPSFWTPCVAPGCKQFTTDGDLKQAFTWWLQIWHRFFLHQDTSLCIEVRIKYNPIFWNPTAFYENVSSLDFPSNVRNWI